LVSHLNRILKGNDLQMIDQVIWLLANSCGESDNIRKIVLSKTFLIDGLTRIICEAINAKVALKNGLIENIIWCMANVTRVKKDLKTN